MLNPDAELNRCVHCILGAFQGLEVPEIIIVTPATFVLEIADKFPFARVIPESRKGIYSAMNDGARLSNGKNIYFLGKDDIVLPAMTNAFEILQAVRPFALFCDVYWGSIGIYRGSPSPVRLLTRNVCHQGIIYSREAFVKHGPYLRPMRIQADHFLNIKVVWDRQSVQAVHYFREPVAWYSGAGFSTTNRDPVFWKLYPQVMRRYVGGWAACFLLMYRKLRGV